MNITPKYLTPKAAAKIYGVHPDFFRKQPELRKYRTVINRRTHLYPVAALDWFFGGCVTALVLQPARKPKYPVRAA